MTLSVERLGELIMQTFSGPEKSDWEPVLAELDAAPTTHVII